MSWDKFLQSETVQRAGITVVGFAIAWLVWQQMNIHIDGRFTSQDARIKQVEESNEFMRDYIEEEQTLRKTLFTAIEAHLSELTKRYHLTPSK